MVVSLKYLGSYRDVFLCCFLNGVKKKRKHLFFHNAIQTPGFKVNLSNASIKQTEIELYYIEMYLLCLLCEPYIFVLALFTKVGWPYSKLNSL